MKSSERAWAIILILFSIFYFEVKYSTKKIVSKVKEEFKDFNFDFDFGDYDEVNDENLKVVKKEVYKYKNLKEVYINIDRVEVNIEGSREKNEAIFKVKFLSSKGKESAPLLIREFKNGKLKIYTLKRKGAKILIKADLPYDVFVRFESKNSKLKASNIGRFEFSGPYSKIILNRINISKINSSYGRFEIENCSKLSINGKYIEGYIKNVEFEQPFITAYSKLTLVNVKKFVKVENKFGKIVFEKIPEIDLKGSYLKVELNEVGKLNLDGKWNSIKANSVESLIVSGKYNTVSGNINELSLKGRHDTVNATISSADVYEESGNISFKIVGVQDVKMNVIDSEVQTDINDFNYYLFVENEGGTISSQIGETTTDGNITKLTFGKKNSSKKIIIKAKYSKVRIKTDSIEI